MNRSSNAIGLALKTALPYALFGFAWVYFSPGAIDELPVSHNVGLFLQECKWYAFIFFTALMLYAYTRDQMGRILRAKEQLKQTEREVIERLSLAAEWRDTETGEHVARVGDYAAAIARKLGQDDEYQEMIKKASSMHDIGKIGIPDRIMMCDGELTIEDRLMMNSHTTLGAELLANGRTPVIQMAQRIALHHHEHWDGTGYPSGLAGEDIPLEARITAVADVLDALISERRYKKAWPFESAVLEIANKAGTHFDPNVVRAFLDSADELRGISARTSATTKGIPATVRAA